MTDRQRAIVRVIARGQPAYAQMLDMSKGSIGMIHIFGIEVMLTISPHAAPKHAVKITSDKIKLYALIELDVNFSRSVHPYGSHVWYAQRTPMNHLKSWNADSCWAEAWIWSGVAGSSGS